MTNQNTWEEFYKNTPLDKIPWQKTQANFLIKIINSGIIEPGLALDLGCGTGMNSIFLAKNGFKVTGVDISKMAIKYAKENAKKEKVDIEFIAANATDLSFLGDKKFDLILDWANLHGILEERRNKYVSELIKHTRKGSKFILRCFGQDDSNKDNVIRPMGKITLFTKEMIMELFGDNFKVLETNTSHPQDKEPPSKVFYEFLMEKF